MTAGRGAIIAWLRPSPARGRMTQAITRHFDPSAPAANKPTSPWSGIGMPARGPVRRAPTRQQLLRRLTAGALTRREVPHLPNGLLDSGTLCAKSGYERCAFRTLLCSRSTRRQNPLRRHHGLVSGGSWANDEITQGARTFRSRVRRKFKQKNAGFRLGSATDQRGLRIAESAENETRESAFALGTDVAASGFAGESVATSARS